MASVGSTYLILFVLLWPYIHWSIATGFTILALEALYFLAPNVKQRFLATLPGAILAVGCWLALSYLLGLYFRPFANFNKTYGTLAAGIAMMTWLYWTGFAMLVGAELNSELAKTDFSSSGATTILFAGTAIAVAQIFPTATRKFSPSDSIPVAYHHKTCIETVGIVRAVGK